MCSARIERPKNPSPWNSLNTGNNSSGAEDGISRNTRKGRRSEVEVSTEIISANSNKRRRIMENGHKNAPSPNRERPLAPLINIILSQSPPLSQSHHSHEGPRHVCNINRCGGVFSNFADLLRHTHHDHRLFKLRHYRLRAVPQCLICNSRSRLLHAIPEDFTNHVYECLQSKRGELGAQWEPPLQGQTSIYSAVFGTTNWYEQLEDNPTSFTEEEYNQIIQEVEDNLIDEEMSDDSLLSSADPEDSVGNVLESPSDTEDEDELCLQIVTGDIARRICIP